MKPSTTLLAAVVLTAGGALFAQKEEGWNPDTTFPALSPAEEIKTIEVPKGQRLVCIASEPMVEEPAAVAFDGNGALYVCEWQASSQNDLPPASAGRAIPMTARFFTSTTRGFNHCRSTPANQ